MKLCLFLLTTAIAALSMAGCSDLVTVRVIDDTSGAALRGACVALLSDDLAKRQEVGKTDLSGEVLFLQPLDLDILEVSKTGYTTVRTRLTPLKEQTTIGPVEVRIEPKSAPTID